MVNKVRIKGKELLSKNTFRLFFTSVASFLIRYGVLFGNVFIFYYFLKNEYSIEYIFVPVLISLLSMLFISGIRLGEQFVYFIRADGGKGRFLLLFKFLSPINSLKATLFYLKTNGLKIFWFLYFLLPTAICGGCSYYLYDTVVISESVSFTLLAGTSALLGLSLVVWRIAVIRYSGASYYFCLDDKKLINRAIKKSIQFTDGSLNEGVVLEYSLMGWILSCVFVAPVVYVLPYIKLCKAIYTLEAVQGRKLCKEKYAINILSVM